MFDLGHLLGSLLGNAGNAVHNVEQGAAHPAQMLNALFNSTVNQGAHQMAQHPQPQPQPTHIITPVGQRLSPQAIAQLHPQLQPLAHIYNENPMDPRVAHLDPSIFGYAPDNSVRPGLQVQPQYAPHSGFQRMMPQNSSFNSSLQGYNQDDLSNGLQGGMVNQGYIPMQGSRGVRPIQGGGGRVQ